MVRLILFGLLLLACALPVRAADPDALWKIVHGRCVPDEEAHENPAPCAAVNLSGGTAVLKDIVGNTQFLLIPTARVTGIEDPAILAPDAPDYWGAAWAVRPMVEARAGHALPRDAISLAINAVSGRTQNQLHIHVDCVRRDIRTAVQAALPSVGAAWAPFPGGLAGHAYRAMRVNQADLAGIDPFRLLHNDPAAAADMAHETLVAVGATFVDGQEGFVLLADQANLLAGDRGSGEELQDHSCAIAQAP